MDPTMFFGVISAVLIANAATLALVFGVIRLRQKDEFDWYSAGSLMFAGGVGMLAAYLAA